MCSDQPQLRDLSLFMWGVGGGGESLGGPGLFFLEKRGGPKENFTMIGVGHCVFCKESH